MGEVKIDGREREGGKMDMAVQTKINTKMFKG